ncbi:MAG: tRNA 2-thiocytidine biosynthesis protein TtcA [Defluviitaleaceae bacterium]|nr:tRNA 2-thiocytidine biosynthesis protein TtcA [Defluviitaleaceae bacterium]
MNTVKKTLTEIQIIERSIHKKFRRELWRKFIRAVQKYELIQADDKIAVCISGGKDSFLMAKLFQQLHRLSETPFDLAFVVMNPGYDAASFDKILTNADRLQVPVQVFDSDIFEIVQKSSGGSPCYLCARMRRGFLYATAQNLVCNKIALGHHMSDVVETTLMGMLYGAQNQTMMPKLKSRNFSEMQLIRPMYCIEEAAVTAWKNYNKLEFIACGGCPLKSYCDEGNISARAAVKAFLAEMKTTNPDVEKNVFNALQCVNLETTIAYKKDGVIHSFLDDF